MLLKSLPGFNILQISQLPFPHGKLTYISTIIYTYVFSPHQRASCLDSILLTLPTFDVIFILFLTPYLPRFCLVFPSILIIVIHGTVLQDFQKPSPSDDVSLRFAIDPRSSVTTHFSSLEP